MNAKEPLQAGLMALPVIYGLTIFINVLTVTMNGSKRKSIEANHQKIPVTEFCSACDGESRVVGGVGDKFRCYDCRCAFLSAVRRPLATPKDSQRGRNCWPEVVKKSNWRECRFREHNCGFYSVARHASSEKSEGSQRREREQAFPLSSDAHRCFQQLRSRRQWRQVRAVQMTHSAQKKLSREINFIIWLFV